MQVYVTLNHKISEVLTNLFKPTLAEAVPPGQTVYVALEQRGAFHEITWASIHEIPANPNQVVL